jgi:hypothetical protein
MEINKFSYDMLDDKIDGLKYNPAIILASSRGGGKSFLLNNGLIQKLDSMMKYSHIFAFSQTDKDVNGLPFMNQSYIYDNLDNLDSIIQTRLNSEIPFEKRSNILCIFNDISGLREQNKHNKNSKSIKNSSSLEYLFSLGRQSCKCSIIVLVQKLTMLSPLVRLNADITFLWVAKSMIVKKKIKEDYFGLAKNKDEVEAVYQNIFNGTPYNCCVVCSYKQGVTKLSDYIYQFLATQSKGKFKTKSFKKIKTKNIKTKSRVIPDDKNNIFNIYNNEIKNPKQIGRNSKIRKSSIRSNKITRKNVRDTNL